MKVIRISATNKCVYGTKNDVGSDKRKTLSTLQLQTKQHAYYIECTEHTVESETRERERKRAGGESRKSYWKQQQSMQNEAYLHRDQMHKIF